MPRYKFTNIANSLTPLPSNIGGILKRGESRTLDLRAVQVDTDELANIVSLGLVTVETLGGSLGSFKEIEIPSLSSINTDLLLTVADSVRDLYVNRVSGSDDNDGLTPATPLKTRQKAVLLFKSPHNPPTWAFGENRTIHILGELGSSDSESIVVPAHSGAGALVIKGQETTVESGLVVGNTPFASIAGYEVRQTMNLTAAGLTPSDYQYNGFVVPQVSLADGVFDETFDCFPILDNAASALTVVALDPGTFSAFSYPAGSLCNIVQPNITWRPEDSSAFSYINIPGVVCLGGPLIIEGFKLEPATVGGTFGSFIQTVASGADADLGSTVILTRNITKSGFSVFVQGEGIAMNGNIIDDAGAFLNLSSMKEFTVNNLAARVGIMVMERGSIYAYGIDHLQTVAALGSIRVRLADTGRLYADTRASTGQVQVQISGCKDYNIGALSVEDAGAHAAVQVGLGACSFKTASNAVRLHGTANNTDVGVDAVEGAYTEASNENFITLSGVAGDLRVGNLAPRAWDSGSQTDPEELVRYST